MLAPLDSIEVNTLLHQLPKRAQLAQEVDSLLDCLENVVNLLLGGETTNTKSDTAVRTLVAVTQSTKNVAGLQGSRGAGTAGRQRNILQGHQERLALNVGKRNVDASRVEVLRVAVLGGVFQRQQAVEESVGQELDTLRVILINLLATVYHRKIP